MNLPQQSIEQILGSSAVNREFGEKIKELDPVKYDILKKVY